MENGIAKRKDFAFRLYIDCVHGGRFFIYIQGALLSEFQPDTTDHSCTCGRKYRNHYFYESERPQFGLVGGYRNFTSTQQRSRGPIDLAYSTEYSDRRNRDVVPVETKCAHDGGGVGRKYRGVSGEFFGYDHLISKLTE